MTFWVPTDNGKKGDFLIQWPATDLEYRINAAKGLYTIWKIKLREFSRDRHVDLYSQLSQIRRP